VQRVYEFRSNIMRHPTTMCAWALVVLVWGCSVYDSQLISEGGKHSSVKTPDAGSADAGPNGSCNSENKAGTCLRAHAKASCVSGECLIVGCQAPYLDCDQDEANGCEATLDSPENCGQCGAACRFNHAAASCDDGHCGMAACNDGYGDCDGDPSNGCETALDSITDCGECAHACPVPPNAVAGCFKGSCGIQSCEGNLADCNGDVADGCERTLNTSDDCGGCGQGCSPAHSQAADCKTGTCVVATCATGFQDCNGSSADGCEAGATSTEDCGACGVKCSLPHVTSTRCDTTAGAASCNVDHRCGGDASNCNPDSAANGCENGFADCDQSSANGCETDLTHITSCGACNVSCVKDHTLTACKQGKCSTVGCATGYDRCAGGNACQSLLDDVNNCGSCGNACPAATPYCAGGKCSSSQCAAGTADCDGTAANACEANLADTRNCGGCGNACGALPHATSLCKNAECQVGNCDGNWGDCDADPSNGCETDLRQVTDCGHCGTVCAFPNATADCSTGTCKLKTCDDQRGDCNSNPADGCETNFKLPSSCGGCGNKCALLPSVLSSTCGSKGCDLVCQAGRADCDANSGNGCEADLADAHSCGQCGNDCTKLPHVASSDCDAGVCKNLTCADGFADCNGDPSDGCERSIHTLTDCGACNQACARGHATADCSSGMCQLGTCDSGFGDCDGNPQNGCEVSLGTTADHCGSCATSCGGSMTCENGACACQNDSQCSSGSTCCSGRCTSIAGSCFPYPCIPGTDLTPNRLNCGGCGAVCLLWCCGPLIPD
jgi:hypothetical protein